MIKFIKKPTVTQNPNERLPLVLMVYCKTDKLSAKQTNYRRDSSVAPHCVENRALYG